MPKKIASRSRADRPEWYARKIQDVADFFRLSYSHICKQRWFSEYAKTRKGYYLPDLAERRHGQVIRAPQALDEDGGKPESIHAKKLEEAHENVRRKRRENDEQEAEQLRPGRVARQRNRRASARTCPMTLCPTQTPPPKPPPRLKPPRFLTAKALKCSTASGTWIASQSYPRAHRFTPTSLL